MSGAEWDGAVGVRHLRGGSAALSDAFRKRDFGSARGILGLGEPDAVPETRPRARSAGCGEGEGPAPGGGHAPHVTGDGREWALSEDGEGAGAELARGPCPTPGRTVAGLIAATPSPGSAFAKWPGLDACFHFLACFCL